MNLSLEELTEHSNLLKFLYQFDELTYDILVEAGDGKYNGWDNRHLYDSELHAKSVIENIKKMYKIRELEVIKTQLIELFKLEVDTVKKLIKYKVYK